MSSSTLWDQSSWNPHIFCIGKDQVVLEFSIQICLLRATKNPFLSPYRPRYPLQPEQPHQGCVRLCTSAQCPGECHQACFFLDLRIRESNPYFQDKSLEDRQESFFLSEMSRSEGSTCERVREYMYKCFGRGSNIELARQQLPLHHRGTHSSDLEQVHKFFIPLSW